MAEMAQFVKMKSATVLYSDEGTAKLVARLPKRAKILQIFVHEKTAFNDSGSDLLDIGTDSDADYYVNDHALGSAAGPEAATLLKGGPDGEGGGIHEVYATYTGANDDATAGEAEVLVVYADPFNS